MPNRPHLVIMARVPSDQGEAKTRLAPLLPARERAALYESFLRDKLAQVARASDFTPAVAVAPPDPSTAMDRFAGAGFVCFEQRGPDLGARLAAVVEHVLVTLAAPFVCIVDSDTPTLPDEVFREAHAALARDAVDLVLGPSVDGGYYLIGLRRPEPTLFRDITWSTSTVLQATLQKARARSLSVHLLPPWRDVDEPDDLIALAVELGSDPDAAARAPFTTKALQGLSRFLPPR